MHPGRWGKIQDNSQSPWEATGRLLPAGVAPPQAASLKGCTPVGKPHPCCSPLELAHDKAGALLSAKLPPYL